MRGFRCLGQQKGPPSQQPCLARPTTPGPNPVTRELSAAELDINFHLLASRPDPLPEFLCSEQKIIFRKIRSCKENFFLLAEFKTFF